MPQKDRLEVVRFPFVSMLLGRALKKKVISEGITYQEIFFFFFKSE